MATSINPAKTANSRVFLIEGRARPDHVPSYQSCMRVTAIDQGLGDIEKIECPDPANYGAFIEIGSIRGAKDRVTTSLEGRYALDTISTMLRLAREGCAVDVQVHLGECTDPSIFNKFKKALILENAIPTNFGTEDLGALASGDNAVVNETLDISATDAYEVAPMSYVTAGDAVVVNEVVDVVICDTQGCGECADQSDGCQKIYAVTKAAGGSPATSPDILFSLNKGVTWYDHDIDSLTASEEPTGIGCIGDYIVIVSTSVGSLSYVDKDDLNAYTDPTFTEVVTGFVAAHNPRHFWSSGAYGFFVGQGGYVYGISDPTAGVTLLEAGVAVVEDLLDVHGLSDQFVVAVGNNGAVIYTTNGSTWNAAPARPVGAGIHLNAVWVKSELEWWVGTSNGKMYYTLNAGITWVEKTFSGSGSGSVNSIYYSTKSIGFMTQTVSTRGKIFRTFDGGQSWTVTPEGSGTLPLTDKINALAACWIDPNFVVGVGLGDNGTDGAIVVGS